MESQSFIVLQQHSRQTQTALELTHSKLQAIEDELADFLDDYYAQVGASFEQLAEYQQELACLQQGNFGVSLDSDAPAPLTSNAIELKQFYRDMARECHPDGAQAQGGVAELKAEMMKTLNAAYARKNLSEMWQLKWEIERQKREGELSHKERLALLKEQQAQMQRTLDELKHKEGELVQSDAYQLMQHARLMQCCGQDFVAMVKGRVQRQLEDTKRELRAARHQARYWSHVKMQRSASKA